MVCHTFCSKAGLVNQYLYYQIFDQFSIPRYQGRENIQMNSLENATFKERSNSPIKVFPPLPCLSSSNYFSIHYPSNIAIIPFIIPLNIAIISPP